MPNFTARTAVVVGATGGLGRAVAEDLILSGARVAVLARDADRLRSEFGDRALCVAADVTDPESTARAFAEVADAFEVLQLAVNAFGVFPKPSPVGSLDSETLTSTLAVNVIGVQRALRHEIALMTNGGAIVNFSSNIGPHRVVRNMGAYAASKAAVSNLTRTAALDHIDDGIRINAISPGSSDTAMSFRAGETRADRDARVAIANPSHRVAAVSEIVAAVRYLLSDEAGYVVGTDLVIDGGFSA
jgi:NAD(P)-dependent dehydrogenase (short-subunit alcohol dehydrogenase family)